MEVTFITTFIFNSFIQYYFFFNFIFNYVYFFRKLTYFFIKNFVVLKRTDFK